MGHTVNVAARLVSAAGPDEVCLVGQPIDGQPVPATGCGFSSTFEVSVRRKRLKGVASKPVSLMCLKQTFKPGGGILDAEEQIRGYVKAVPDLPRLD